MNKLSALKTKIHSLLDEGNHIETKQLLLVELQNLKYDDENYWLICMELAGFFIDLGAESYDKECVSIGIEMIMKNKKDFTEIITEQSLNYCLANGFHAFYKIQNLGRELPTLEMIKPDLIEAKNYYFKAFKEIDLAILDGLDIQILTNLGNNLSQSGRIIEAVRLYNSVLKSNPNFSNALLGFAENLDYWIRISFCPQSISLLSEIYCSLQNGLQNGNLPPRQKQYFEGQLSFYKNKLEKLDFDFSSLNEELEITKREYQKHSSFRKFCIDNYLALNEHSLFCKCSESSKDNLSMLYEGLNLYGDKLGKLEFLLNRIKSEFHLARKLYFEGITLKHDNEDVLFSEMMDREAIGENIEKIRTAFRLCFGILDKIAHGVCYFFELPKKPKNDLIYFEKFWQDYDERWKILKDLRNPHLVALYSIANDFNSKNGEFFFYKQWRNKLEHNNLVLVDSEEGIDLLDLFDDTSFVTKISLTIFKEQGLHLLQICNAAIYSYVYAIRRESLNSKTDGLILPFIITPKSER